MPSYTSSWRLFLALTGLAAIVAAVWGRPRRCLYCRQPVGSAYQHACNLCISQGRW